MTGRRGTAKSRVQKRKRSTVACVERGAKRRKADEVTETEALHVSDVEDIKLEAASSDGVSDEQAAPNDGAGSDADGAADEQDSHPVCPENHANCSEHNIDGPGP